MDKELGKKWKMEARDKVARPWAAELARQAPAGSRGAAAGRSIQAGLGQGVRIYMGKGVWKQGFQPFFGIEYGMNQDVKHKYVRRNRSGRGRHFVNRRVGTWAPEWIPKHTYVFRRYWEKNERKVRSQVVNLVNEFVAENL
jgi:hypothetical protein